MPVWTTTIRTGRGWSRRWLGEHAHARTDRAGVGRSDVRPSRAAVVRAEQIVDELHDLLARADVSPPYVLVGHSLGGLNARLFTQRHSGDIAGLVLVDPTSPDYFGRGETSQEWPKGAAISYRTAYATARSVTFGDLPAIVLHARAGRASTESEARDLANTYVERAACAHLNWPRDPPGKSRNSSWKQCQTWSSTRRDQTL